MDWELFWRYALHFSAVWPAALICLAPVWEFQRRPGRVLIGTPLFLAAGTFGGAALCVLTHLNGKAGMSLLLTAAALLYLLSLRGMLSVWRAAFSFFSGAFFLAVCDVLAVLIHARGELGNTAGVVTLGTALISLGLMAGMTLLNLLTASKWLKWLLREYETERIWRAIWLLPAIYTALYLFSAPRDTSVVLVNRVQQISVLTGLLPVGIYILFLYLFYCIGRESACNLRLMEENHVLTLESRRYEELQTYMEKTRTLRHDFRQHLHVIAGLSEAGRIEELQDYLKQYAGELTEERTSLCANAAVDAIAGYYDAAARREQIPVVWRLELPQKLPLAEADLCMMLGNLMENAIRACAALPQQERRVEVICRMLSPGMLGLIVENSYDGVLRRQGAKLLSTAHDGSGAGLMSVQTTVRRYGGEMTLETEHKIFRVNILLNL